ncbi:hypothetical protein IE53DRAFT_387994 [Violaceomyces palustris]|uniref:Uncharacterized protein n=1 Tax=Violaceomyces palustris TaxID=1673888 RepID=A0ACD0NVE5_9BASI|nr:hypothetical protein IE53DRAFT_387994 [Violaceomyces palustris]
MASPTSAVTRKLKILMAHGYTSNSFIFQKRSGAIRRACKDVADFTFVNGPHIVQPITSAGDLDSPDTEGKPIDENTPIEEQPRAWWKANSFDATYELWPETVQYLNKVFEKEGPFDAVWGFSQGACLTGLLASAFEKPERVPGLKLPNGQGPLRFAIAVSGFRSRDPSHQTLFQEPIQTPVLHVLGRADQIVDLDRSQTLIDVCANSRVELHDGGHSLPSQAAWRNFFRDFIATFASEPYVANKDWLKVIGPSERPKGENTPSASGANTPTHAQTYANGSSRDDTNLGGDPNERAPASVAADATTSPSSSSTTTTAQAVGGGGGGGGGEQGEQDIDPSNPNRRVPKKKANAPFLVHQRWKEEQEAQRRAQALAQGQDFEAEEEKRRERKREEEERKGRERKPSAFVKAAAGLFRYAIMGLAIALLAGQFFAGDALWGYRGKWTKLRTYMPYKERIYSLPELALYNGRDPEKPILLSIMGDVYDVTAGSRIYGPGGGYEFFSGRDASRSYVTGCFETHLTHDIRGLTALEISDIMNWKRFFDTHEKYFKVGRVVLPTLTEDDPIPEDCEQWAKQKLDRVEY